MFGERVGEAETRGEPAVIWNADTFTTASVDGLMAVQDDTNSYGYTWCLILRGVTAEDVPPGSIVTSALRDAYRPAV